MAAWSSNLKPAPLPVPMVAINRGPRAPVRDGLEPADAQHVAVYRTYRPTWIERRVALDDRGGGGSQATTRLHLRGRPGVALGIISSGR